MKRFLWGSFFTFLGIVAILAIGKQMTSLQMAGLPKGKIVLDSSLDFTVGTQVWIDAEKEGIFIATDEMGFKEIYEGLNIAHDPYTGVELFRYGRAFIIKKNTRALVLDRGFESGFDIRKIRILDGENAGKAGWTYVEVLHRSPLK